ncbi:MAG: hypothetical protein HYY18_12655 [Planctomycetes bacterium]|nr:hypothetical protein [Planctomycetota bacterium]
MLREAFDEVYAVHTVLEEIERAVCLAEAGGYTAAVRDADESCESESLLGRIEHAIVSALREGSR